MTKTSDNRRGTATLETFEWVNTWFEQTGDRTTPRILYIGDSVSIPTRSRLNTLLSGRVLFDGFASSKALDDPRYLDAVALFASEAVSPYRAVLFNNGLHGWHLDDAAGYPEHYKKIVGGLGEIFDGARIVLLTTTRVADPDSDARVRRRNEAVAGIASETGLSVIDLYIPDPLPALLSVDGVHLTESGYDLLARKAADALSEII